MKVYIYTLGCKVNQYESQVMAEQMRSAGHTICEQATEADCIIINSCTVTAESDRKTRQAVRRFRKLRPEAVIMLAGCMPQAFPEEAYALEAADVITGNTSHGKMPEYLARFIQTGQPVREVTPHGRQEDYTTPSLTSFSDRTRAFMKIEDGCDRYCTYCTIPKARGPIRSRSLEDITSEAEALAKEGFKEIVLVGINLTSYGRETGLTICDAVRAAAKPSGIKRVRLGSLEPDHISDATLEGLCSEEKFCPQFHLALQSGCDATLKRMNRHYDTAFYRDLVKRIRAKFKDCSITTDIMVGFPGESEEEFRESLAFFKEIGFARGHVFAYSRRAGTVAAALPGQLCTREKEARAALMSAAAAECEAAFLAAREGKTTTVLFETVKDGIYYGYTPNYSRVAVPCTESIEGKILPVRLIEACGDFCKGTLI